MCGIAGIINLEQKPVDRCDVEKMIKVVKHRGPDDEGYFIDKNIGLGHCRLSIIDLSEAGHQPMTNQDKTIWIIHNGEIYNFVELREELEIKGHRFKSNTDTEVIIHSYEEWGKDALVRFNGMWAFALWDTRKRELFCSRDRFGIKPFYYYLDKQRLIFGSEIKELLISVNAQENEEVIFNYLVLGFENYSEETFFKDIKELPGGHYLSLRMDAQDLAINKYYTFFDNSQTEKTQIDKSTDYYSKFRNLLEDSIKIRLRSDVPVGSCLSGGLDSSSIVCLSNKILGRGSIYRTRSNCRPYKDFRQEVFTACFEQKNIDERKFADEVIKKTDCVKNFIFPDFQSLKEDLEKLIWHQEEPFGGLSVFSQWSIMKAAKEKGIKVLLDGQAGDELLLGYERYYVYFLKELLRELRLNLFLKEFFLIPKNSKLSLKRLIQYYVYFSLPRVRLMKLLKQSRLVLNKKFLSASQNKRVYSFIKPENLRELQRNELLHSQLPHLLRYEDRNSMAFSTESRLPFLDYRLVEFVYRLSANYKINNGWTKYILRESMKDILPSEIGWRKRKIGFEVPDIWLKMLQPEIEEIFRSDICSKRYINKRLFLKNLAKDRIPAQLLWRGYCLELWMRKFI